MFTGGRDHGTQAGGRRRRRHKSKRHTRRTRKGGCGNVMARAAVPLGLFALQRFFKGSKSTKRGVHNMGNTFKRTFRRSRR